MLKSICTALTYNYMIAAEVPYPDSQNLTLSYTSTVTQERMNTGLYERLRARLGLSPYTADSPITRAFQADSYHFQMRAPTGQFVVSQHLEALGDNQPLKQEYFVINGVQQYVRLYHEEGRTTAHLYIRRQGVRPKIELNNGNQASQQPNIPEAVAAAVEKKEELAAKKEPLSVKGFKTVVQFQEIPPGLVGHAHALSALMSTLIVFLTLTHVGLGAQANGFQGMPALLLAAPAFIAGALGRAIDSTSMARSSLVTYFSLWGIVLTSFAAVLTYVAQSAGTLLAPVSVYVWPAPTDWRWKTDVWWLALSGISVALTIYLWKEKRSQLRYYLNMLAKLALDNTTKSRDNESRITGDVSDQKVS